MLESIRSLVIQEALTWEKTPYHHRAKVKGAGCDCLTFLIGVAENVGIIKDFDVPEYSAQFSLHKSNETYLDGLLKHCREVEYPRPADIVIWKFGRVYSHAALVIDWPTIIHSASGIGVTRDSANSNWLAKVGNKPRPHKFFSYW